MFIEEAFERMLLDYDRVFSAMGVPACLWRRTGEIYKGNREFTELVGVDGYMMRDVSGCVLYSVLCALRGLSLRRLSACGTNPYLTCTDGFNCLLYRADYVYMS